MAQSLYNRYRPRTFGEVLGQAHVVRTLRNAIKHDRVGHAYLFCGTRGVGKTTMARLLAKAVNCQRRGPGETDPCGADDPCAQCQAIGAGQALDVIEIDGASNRGIDDVRQIRERINFSPNQARYKFYIIDEVHRLTQDAFNALLKTLEEPPPHAKFVFATTEPLRLPTTILSRCQRFDLHHLSVADLTENLRRVCDGEGFRYEEGALELLARAGNGSSRDALSLLEQANVYCDSHLTLASVREMLGYASDDAVEHLSQLVIERQAAGALSHLHAMALEGTDLRELGRQLLEHWRALMLVKTGGPAAQSLGLPAQRLETLHQQAAALSLVHVVRVVGLIHRAVSELGDAVQPQLPLELAIIAAVHDDLEARPADTPRPTVAAPPAAPREPAPQRLAARAQPQAEPPAAIDGGDEVTGAPGLKEVREAWPALLRRVRAQKRWTLEAMLRSSTIAEVHDGRVSLLAQATAHCKQIEDHRELIESELAALVNHPLGLVCSVKGSAPQRPPAARPRPVRDPAPAATALPQEFDEAPPGDGLLEDDDDLMRAAREMFGSQPDRP